ncbi:Abi-alpha family protein [Nocardioides caeni]|uniref:DUF4393 domain-containing protein n=1 Tax=Nocardioides caeni TaxID=574700 RepID=A0A4V4HJN2_9ACTN|nr:Abi-alpha family protein [Nocardioides caeni]THV11226.1 DUF4393 domain-containing protein [Nocardioides caeni]
MQQSGPPSRQPPIDPAAIIPAAVTATVSATVTTLRLTRRAAGWTERQVLGALRTRLDAAAPSAPLALPAPARPADSLQTKLSGLLEQALELGSNESRQALFVKILDQIVPDEARILGALSDGSAAPLLQVYSRSRGGLVRETVLENASLVGKSANIGLPHLTPMYVSHLLALGLLEVGPEDVALKEEYEILGADSAVLRAVRTASRGPIPAGVDRQTLRLSELGHELWRTATEQG